MAASAVSIVPDSPVVTITPDGANGNSKPTQNIPTEAQAAANPPVAPINQTMNKVEPLTGSQVTPQEEQDIENRAAKVRNTSITPVTNASLIYAAPGLGQATKGAVSRVEEFLNPEAGKEAAGAAFNEVAEAIGDHPVHMTDKMADALSELKEGIDTGGHNPQVVNKLVTRLADVDEGPLTYKEARGFYSNLGDLSTADKTALNTKMGRLINNLRVALGESIKDTAEAGEKSAQYQGAMSGWAKAAGDSEKLEAVKELVKKYGTKAAIGTAAYGLYRELESIFK